MNVIPSIKKLEAAVAASHAMPHPYAQKLVRALDQMGNLYLLQDILTRVADGRMQSFAQNDSVMITQIGVFPRARVLEILIAVGSLADQRILFDRVLEYARQNDIGLVQSIGRIGWTEMARRDGWKVKARQRLFHREL